MKAVTLRKMTISVPVEHSVAFSTGGTYVKEGDDGIIAVGIDVKVNGGEWGNRVEIYGLNTPEGKAETRAIRDFIEAALANYSEPN